MFKYNGKLVLLGHRTVRLPSDEDLSCMKPEAGKYAHIDAVMPVKNDIIGIDGYDGEWLVEQSGQSLTWNWRQCGIRQVTGITKLALGAYSSLRIAYDETGLDPKFKEDVSNVKQAMCDAVRIIGQAQLVSFYVRIPELPKGVKLVPEN